VFNNPYRFTDPDGRRPAEERPTDPKSWNDDDWKDHRNEHAVEIFDSLTGLPSLYADIRSGNLQAIAIGFATSRFGGRALSRAGVGMLGAKGAKIVSNTVWRGKLGRLDVENPAPGKRSGQIHFQPWADKKAKYLYDADSGTFKGAPRAVNNLLENKEFKKNLQKALKMLGEEE
jgi:hypothetical protein